MIYQQNTLNCRGRIITVDRPLVMGILNLTPDSFYDGGVHDSVASSVAHVGTMLDEGAAIVDVGAFSSRPGAAAVAPEDELARLLPVLSRVVEEYPRAIFSVDTMQAEVAFRALEAGAHIINDISGGRHDPAIIEVCAKAGAPFIVMHMQGNPQTMQANPAYDDVTEEVLRFFVERIRLLRNAGVKDILLDPGFGFGKNLGHNYELLDKLGVFKFLELPIVAGVSRKSMICKVLGIPPAQALNGTTALHMLALEKGARILRAHDVKEAVETIRLYEYYRDHRTSHAEPQTL